MTLDGRATKPVECLEAEYGQARGLQMATGVMVDSVRATQIPFRNEGLTPQNVPGLREDSRWLQG